jgi:hypothetical protein
MTVTTAPSPAIAARADRIEIALWLILGTAVMILAILAYWSYKIIEVATALQGVTS